MLPLVLVAEIVFPSIWILSTLSLVRTTSPAENPPVDVSLATSVPLPFTGVALLVITGVEPSPLVSSIERPVPETSMLST